MKIDIKKYAVLIVLFISLSLSANHVVWENPIFVNKTDLAVTKVEISTTGQDEEYAVRKNRVSDYIQPGCKEELIGNLGGIYKIDSFDYELYKTHWKIKAICNQYKSRNVITLATETDFNNEFSNGPALSMWPCFPNRINMADSKLILFKDSKTKQYYLNVSLVSDEGEVFTDYSIPLDLKKIELTKNEQAISI